jgi:hypothetical protein
MRQLFERVEDGVTAAAVDAGRAAMHSSIDGILEYKPTAAHLTHYTADLQA